MYYVFNFVSCCLSIMSIAMAYDKSVPSWSILLSLFVAGLFQVIAANWVLEKYDDFEKRIKNLENEKKDKK